MSDPNVIMTVSEVPPADSSTYEWIGALAEEIAGVADVEYVPNASGGYDVVVDR